MKQTIFNICNTRDDSLAKTVKDRLGSGTDLVADEARYHRLKFKEKRKESPGRPTNQNQKELFEKLCEWLESEMEAQSMSDIHKKQHDFSVNEKDIYSAVWLQNLLKDQYGKNIKFVQEEGKPDIVYFDNLGDYLISDKWYKERKKWHI